MRKVRILDEARSEFLDRLSYYRQIDRDLARAFRDEFRQQRAQVERFPESFPQVPLATDWHVRRALLERFAHAVVFVLLDTEIVIVAIHHQHRKPGYWKSRLASVRPSSP